MKSSLSFVLVLGLVAGCGAVAEVPDPNRPSSVHADTSAPSWPVITSPTPRILTTLNPGALPEAPVDVPIRTAIVWQGIGETTDACIGAAGDDDAVQDCLAFAPEGDLAFLADPMWTSAELPASEVPASELIQGCVVPNYGLLAWGVVAAFADSDENYALSVGDPEDPTREPEAVLGASVNPAAPDALQTVLVFHDGREAQAWRLFEARGCGAQPTTWGFTLLKMETTAAGTVCTQTDLYEDWEAKIPLHWDDARELRELACEPQHLPATVRPDEVGLPSRARYFCEGPFTVHYEVGDGVCPSRGRFDLAGCENQTDRFDCEGTSWDLRNSPPAWWPCES